MAINTLPAQSISGRVTNANGEPVPFADVLVRELQTGTNTDADGRYYMVIDVPGEYELVFSSMGYETKADKILLGNGPLVWDVVLGTSSTQLDEVVVKASKRDPAYEIIRKAVENKGKFLRQSESFRAQVYMKATEVVDEKERERRRKENAKDKPAKDDDTGLDDFDKAEQERVSELMKISMLEMRLTLNYQHPNRYKEEREAYKVYGDKSGLFVPLFGELDFNFYRNMVQMTGIAETPVISPISRTAILAYKYKLEETLVENGEMVYKIKVIPRKKGNSTCSGTIYINDDTWNINRLEFDFHPGGLKFFDKFTLKQNYQQIQDSIWIPNRLEFIYETKQGKRRAFKGNTLVSFSDYEHNHPFPPRFFKNELAVTTRDAYTRDSSYWNNIRPEKLKAQELEMTAFRDSIYAIRNSKEYKDSMQAAYNKITALDLFWDGLGFRNHEKKQHIYVGSIPELLDFSIVGGFRLGPYMGYSRRWENGRYISSFGGFNIGVKNLDLQGDGSVRFRYHAHKRAHVWLNGGRSFHSINNFDAYLNQLRTSNYILHDKIGLGHSFEAFNGFQIEVDGDYALRKSVEGYDTETFIDNLFDEDEPPLDFEDYEALTTELEISYTPGQKYLTEPTRKINLGSKYPTFSIRHRRGWRGVLSSDVDFDYLEFGINQDITLRSLGHSKYNFRVGRYLNTRELKVVDLNRFRQSDPILYSNPLHSFQALDTAFATTNIFIEFHHIHHFNGALINNIPLIKKTRVRAVVGGGILWVRDGNFRHSELFGGLERVFKIGKRRRLRVGCYGVFAKSSYAPPQGAFKVSFDLIDTWKKDWSY